MATYSKVFYYHPCSHIGVLQPPDVMSDFGLYRFRSSLLTVFLLVSFPPGTEIFQFPEFPSRRIVGITQFSLRWVSPFGNRRIKGCLPPPRRLSQVSHVLLRLLAPRHSLSALIYFMILFTFQRAKWTVRDSNPLPLQCKCSALPIELTAPKTKKISRRRL